jgi:hypothetical protein
MSETVVINLREFTKGTALGAARGNELFGEIEKYLLADKIVCLKFDSTLPVSVNFLQFAIARIYGMANCNNFTYLGYSPSQLTMIDAIVDEARKYYNNLRRD